MKNYLIFQNKVLGEGSFGKVLEGEDTNDHKTVAFKVLSKQLIIPMHILEKASKTSFKSCSNCTPRKSSIF